MRRFSLTRRGNIWYAQIFNQATGKYLPGRPTGESDRRAAEHVADDWIEHGMPDKKGNRRPIDVTLRVASILDEIRKTPLTHDDAQKIVRALKDRDLIETAVVKAGPGSEGLISFLTRFWNFESSPYVREKLAHGQRMGRRHCYDMALHVTAHWEPHFGKQKRLADLRKAELRDFALWLAEEKHLAPKTINHAMAAGTVALRWAFESEYIPSNPAQGLLRFSGTPAKRGILNEGEVKRLFAKPWSDKRAWLGNALAMSTGLRLGEVLGLQVRDIEEARLRVRHSWSEFDGLKSTKMGEERTVPLLPELRTELLDLARENPHGIGPFSFIFWSTDQADRPMGAHGLADPLKDALLGLTLADEDRTEAEKVKRAKEYWRSRRVCFHSWRHYYAARMADRLEARKVMSATGHKSAAVFEVYADHVAEETLSEVQAVTAETFGKLLPFRATRGTQS